MAVKYCATNIYLNLSKSFTTGITKCFTDINVWKFDYLNDQKRCIGLKAGRKSLDSLESISFVNPKANNVLTADCQTKRFLGLQ